MTRTVALALAVWLIAIAVALAVVLTRSPVEVLGTNHVAAHEVEAFVHKEAKDCQQGGTIPAGTSAIRESLGANIGPKVSVQVLSGSRVLTSGERPAGWGEDAIVTVPVRELDRAVERAVVCTTVGPAIEYLEVRGTRVAASSPAGENLAGASLRLEYLRNGGKSWFAHAASIARRIGFGTAGGGPWVAFVVLLAMAGVVALAVRLAYRELS